MCGLNHHLKLSVAVKFVRNFSIVSCGGFQMNLIGPMFNIEVVSLITHFWITVYLRADKIRKRKKS